MATYKPLSERAKALYGDQPFEADFTEGEENDLVSGGHVDVVPRPYRVLVDNYAGGKLDDVVDLALTQGQAATLVNILEPVEAKSAKADPKK